MNANRKNMSRFALIGAVPTIGGLALVAPASAAAPAPAPAAAVSVTSSAAPAAAGHGDPVKVVQGRVAITVTNDTAQTIHVRMNGKSITGVVEKDLKPGESLRAAGHTLASSQDVSGTVTYANGSSVDFWGYNPDFGYPSVGFGNGSNWERFYVDETHNYTESGHAFSVTRHGDLDIGGGKDFSLSVR